MIKVFERHCWRIESVDLGYRLAAFTERSSMHHDEKYLHINNAFAGKQRLMPFFNRPNNEDLILAIRSAGVSNGRNRLLLCSRATSWSARISPARNSRSRKKTCSNTALTGPTLSTLSTLAAKNFRSTILFHSPQAVFSKKYVNLYNQIRYYEPRKSTPNPRR